MSAILGSSEPERKAGLKTECSSSQDKSAVDSSSARKRLFYEVESSVTTQEAAAGAVQARLAALQARSANVRLSMSLDGKAKIRTKDSETPSPPKARAVAPAAIPRPQGTLQRSKSMVSTMELSKGTTQSMPMKSTIGRSRDARTWEFFCDSEVRDALSAQAERERRGSAAGAINLIRSNSKKALLQRSKSNEAFRGPLTPKAGSGNAQKATTQSSQKLKSKPHLSRATSSLARLQANRDESKGGSQETMHLNKRDSATRPLSPSGDSDKENWEPGSQASHVRRRPVIAADRRSRSILSENHQILSHSSGLDRTLASSKAPVRANASKSNRANEENISAQDKDEDEEVSAFMGGSNVPNEEEDLNCIQGLLSLSQGAWR